MRIAVCHKNLKTVDFNFFSFFDISFHFWVSHRKFKKNAKQIIESNFKIKTDRKRRIYTELDANYIIDFSDAFIHFSLCDSACDKQNETFSKTVNCISDISETMSDKIFFSIMYNKNNPNNKEFVDEIEKIAKEHNIHIFYEYC